MVNDAAAVYTHKGERENVIENENHLYAKRNEMKKYEKSFIL